MELDQRDRILLTLEAITNDFKVFVDDVITFDMKNPGFLDELDDVISNPLYKKVCIAMPRGHGKSQHLSFAYPLWEIAKNHNIRILIISKTARTASKFAQQIMGFIENNQKYRAWAKAIDPKSVGVGPKFRKIAGRRVEEKWSSDGFIIDRDNMTLKDPTLTCVGLFGSILGGRADLIIADDIVDQVNSETPDQREKVKRWFYDTVLPCLVPGGRVLYLGNTWQADDLIADLLNNVQFDYRKKLAAIKHEAERQDLWQQYGNMLLDESIHPLQKRSMLDTFYFQNREEMDKGVDVLWPELFPYRDLYAQRLFNSFSFQRMMMCDASQNPNQIIKEEWIQESLRKGKKLKLQRPVRYGLTTSDTTGGLDLAISEKDTADYTALITVDMVEYGMDEIKTGDYVIRDLISGHFSPAKTRQIVKEAFFDIGHSELRVESVGFQQSIVNDLIDVPGMAGYVKGYKTGSEKNDEFIGVNVIATLFEQGKIIIPADDRDVRTMEEVSALLAELRSWPLGHTGDRLMALWFAISAMREHKKTGWNFPGMNDPLSEAHEGMTQEEIDKQLDLIAIRESEAQRRGQSNTWTW